MPIAGINRPISLQSLRYTFATRLYGKIDHLHLAQRALSHRQIMMEFYARLAEI